MFEILKFFDVFLNDDVVEWRRRKGFFFKGIELILFF